MQQYLKFRRYFECGFWVCVLTLAFATETLIVLIEIENRALSIQTWEVLVWQASSLVIVGILIPTTIWFDRYFPLQWRTIKSAPIAHGLFSVVFSITHVSLMVLIRKGVYLAIGANYSFGDIGRNFAYEYAKDFKTYLIILAVLYLYRHILFRAQGEASVVDDVQPKSESASLKYPERFLVKKLGKEFLVKVTEIQRIEASGNYVNLHVGNSVYPLRDTMTNISERLDPSVFQRLHRSHIVNLNHIGDIQPDDSGDAIINMISGETVPVSRRYRSALKVGT